MNISAHASAGFMPSVHTAREKKRTFVHYVGVPHTQQFGSYFYSPVGKQLPSLRSHTILAVLLTDGLTSFIRSLVFSLRGRAGRNQSPVM